MLAYAARRILHAVPLLLLISVLLFTIVHLPPGGPAALYAADPSASQEDIRRLEELWGLNQPLTTQYIQWGSNLLKGDWGRSYHERRPVLNVVVERLPATLLLTMTALVVAVLIGVPLGVIGATRSGGPVYYAVQVLSVLGLSVPTFWSGTLLILVFGVWLRVLPPGGMYTIGAPFSLTDRLLHLAGPVAVLSSAYIAYWARYTQGMVLEVMADDYIRSARAKGLTERRVLYRHALPNAALPLVTLLGLEVPRLFSGALVTEVVFAWPGLGRLISQSLLNRDYPVVLGALMLLSGAVIIGNLVADLGYGLVDPRVRYE